ncbi:hypothetical protein [Clostridium sp. AM49-4BH]|uniref:hypothetical protein n=1 Tax=Clostridium sp. AM49-4BH TaxID=2293035 RepID=UPI000E4B970E|nr:hypothetical protein [Clostridium sp. AM49-4BH]RHQ09200.1 hypothetical protein DW981_13530 [Clostridium sp. AM49-4BH]
MKRNRQIIIAILILVAFLTIAIATAFFFVKYPLNVNGSSDGWLGFLGGLFGSFLSGIISIYILNVNRRDAEEMTRKNHKDTKDAFRQNANMFHYQMRTDLTNAVYELLVELIIIAEFCNCRKNINGQIYSEKQQRAQKICMLIALKLGNECRFNGLLSEIEKYNNMYIQKRRVFHFNKGFLEKQGKYLCRVAQICLQGYIYDIYLR